MLAVTYVHIWLLTFCCYPWFYFDRKNMFLGVVIYQSCVMRLITSKFHHLICRICRSVAIDIFTTAIDDNKWCSVWQTNTTSSLGNISTRSLQMTKFMEGFEYLLEALLNIFRLNGVASTTIIIDVWTLQQSFCESCESLAIYVCTCVAMVISNLRRRSWHQILFLLIHSFLTSPYSCFTGVPDKKLAF